MKTTLISVVILASVVAIPDGNAATVFQWTDEDGVVHFSDTAPAADSAIETHKIEFGSFDNPDSSPEKYSIIEQANIMAEWRRQETEQRLTRKQLALEQERLDREMELNQQRTQDNIRDYYRQGLNFYGLPGAVGYRTQRPWYNRQNQRRDPGSRSHQRNHGDNVSDYVKNGKGLQLYMSGRIN